MKFETYDKEVNELCKEFSELVEPTIKTAKLAEKIFTIIGNLQGQLKVVNREFTFSSSEERQ